MKYKFIIKNLNTFLIIILFGYIIKNSYKDLIQSIMFEDETGTENDINYISELKGQFFLNPVLSITLTICFIFSNSKWILLYVYNSYYCKYNKCFLLFKNNKNIIYNRRKYL